MNNKNFKKKSLSISLKSLAFALGLTATASTTSFAMPVKQTKTIESHDHEHELDIEKTIVEINNKYSGENKKVYNLININQIKNITISNYNGGSIVEALNKAGIDSSYKNRKILASNMGIKNYRGTAKQNIELLNLLKGNVNALATTSNIKTICYDLFGANADIIISDLQISNKTNITKSEFATIIRKISNYMGVNTNSYNSKLGTVIKSINDIETSGLNSNDIAWSYYMGYTDIDNNLNYNSNMYITINDLNAWINSFVYDYNTSVINNKYDNNGLLITPNVDSLNRDENDISKINDIRNEKTTTSSSKKHHGGGSSSNKHYHNYGKWTYYNETTEVSICKDCGSKKYKSHTLTNSEKIYTTNNDGTHKVNETAYCNNCDITINREYNAGCGFNEWNYNSLTGLDERKCNDCNYTEKRAHEHNVPTNLNYTFDSTNNDGTHKMKATYTCSKCNETVVLYKDVNCNLSEWTYNLTTQLEERECSICNYIETRTHEHNVPTNLNYTFDRTNDDGTHKLSATYRCDVCENNITLSKNEDCQFGNWQDHGDGFSCEKVCNICGYEKVKSHNLVIVPNRPALSNPTIGKHFITKECSDCDYINEHVVEDCIGDGHIDYYENNGIVTERERCSICGEICKDEAHEHVYGAYESIDSEKHMRKCGECGHEVEQPHSYGAPELNESGQYESECSDCHEILISDHIHQLPAPEKAYKDPKDKEYCYKLVSECEVDGCDYKEITGPISHDYEVTTRTVGNITYTTYKCSCGYQYSEENINTFSLKRPVVEETPIEEEKEEIIVEEVITEEIIKKEEPIVEENEEIIEETIIEEEIIEEDEEIKEETIEEIEEDTLQEETQSIIEETSAKVLVLKR